MLSREQYRLGTRLPLDRLLSFYYANPGFVLTNVSAIVAIECFVLFLVCIAALGNNLTLCPEKPILGDLTINMTHVDANPPPENCADLLALDMWLRQMVFSFLPVFIVSFFVLGLELWVGVVDWVILGHSIADCGAYCC